MELMSLKALCEKLEISRRSIQCYERAGLMAPTGKNKYGHLLYDEAALRRAETIRFLQRLGLKLREVKEIIDAPGHVRKEVLEERLKELEKEKARLERFIQAAGEYVRKLEEEGGDRGKELLL